MHKLRAPEEAGDLYAEVDVQLPTELRSGERELFEELQCLSEGGD